MSVFSGAVNDSTVTTGTVPAWAVVFRNEGSGEKLRTISSDTYYGSVSATLPAGLAGGAYEIVIEGLTDEDYAKIRLPAGTPVSAELHLWWKDAPTGVLGDLARFTGLDNPFGAVTQDPPEPSVVAVIRVDRMQRRAGARRVEMVISGRELVWSRLAERRVQGRCFKDLQTSITGITRDVVPVVGHGLEAARPDPAQVDVADVAPGTILEAMTTQIQQVQTVMGLYGLQVAMIRDGTLHVGEWTANAATPRLDSFRPLDDRSGLLCVERGNACDRDVRVGRGRPGSPASRLTVAVTTLGRPDIKPGDLVAVVLPAQDFPAVEPPSIGATLLSAVPSPIFGDPGPPAQPSLCRVADVTHKLSREQGFLTTFQALVLASGDDGWDRPGQVPARPATPVQQKGTPFSDSAHGAASAVNSVILGTAGRMAASNRSRLGMVHDHAAGGGVPRHTSDVWYADITPDGFPGAVQRTAVNEDQHGELLRVPYVTPFAWGSYGMVLPRYPGTRVVLANAGGGPGDFVDVGAVWPRNAGPDAQPGDYWLALPVSIAQREHLQDPAKQLPDDGPATHDLIDGDGTRVIETSRFVLRVTDGLTQVPNRPQPGDDPAGSVVIENRSGQDISARIVLKDDGSVTITATSITFDTQGRGDIELKAKNVNVHLDGGGTMDVS